MIHSASLHTLPTWKNASEPRRRLHRTGGSASVCRDVTEKRDSKREADLCGYAHADGRVTWAKMTASRLGWTLCREIHAGAKEERGAWIAFRVRRYINWWFCKVQIGPEAGTGKEAPTNPVPFGCGCTISPTLNSVQNGKGFNRVLFVLRSQRGSR